MVHIEGVARPDAGEAEVALTVPVPRRTVWAALTEPARLATWLGRVEGSLTDPAGFVVRHDAETASRHRVTHRREQDSWALTWDFPEEPPSAVAFALTGEPEGPTTVTVLHAGLADAVGYAAGWHRHLELLGAHLLGAPAPGDFWDGHDVLVARYRPVDRSGREQRTSGD